ncbi:5'-nucleotidase [Pseudomassariella vexata]|uniref:5'-nucleotidase n=1 Tax=Pseudomassariella vexata TaxID=1141098 RepID=A0A1Y2EIH9_9PEZI|nr:5'-nucleotidase [Pseudomassariella vexata]ORY71380.1 5'-nucleotidase [Pseudomassariella vexata]
MARSMLSLLSLATASLVGLASAEDVLYSQRMSKRFIDDEGNYNISFYHINDVHAHLDQFSSSGTDCTSPTEGCYGGYARVKTVLDDTRPEHPDSLLLNVGDEFQGTLFYSFYRGEKIAETLNQIGFDGMTIGNHEFDGGDDELGDFLKNLTFPIISANIVSDNEKLNSTIKPYHIYDEYELAVIGVTTETTASISSPGSGTTFTDAIEAVQNTVDLIRSTTNITRIAAITHIGYEEDMRLAQETTGLYFIMGGHSHTLLGDMEDASGPYPTIEQNKDGDDVFIVTAYRWGEYLGYIDVTYDAEGKVLAYHGAPIHLTNTTEQDEDLQEQVDAWREPFEEFAAEEVGTTNVVLDQSTCQEGECLLGDFIADAMLQYRLDADADIAFAVTNAGGIRATIDAGPITRGQVLTAFPFGNAVVELTYTGEELWTVFEGVVSGVNQINGEEVTSFFQISKGIKVEYNPDGEVGSRLETITIGDSPIDNSTTYTIVTIDFLAGGGDNIFEPVDDLVVLDTLDEVLVEYIKAQSPIDIELDGRISTVTGGSGSGSGDATGTATGTASTPSETSNGVSGLGPCIALFVFTLMLSIVVL